MVNKGIALEVITCCNVSSNLPIKWYPKEFPLESSHAGTYARCNLSDEHPIWGGEMPFHDILRNSSVNEDGKFVQTSCNVPMCPRRMRNAFLPHPTVIGRSPDRPHVYQSRSFEKFLSLLFSEESYRAISQYGIHALPLNLFSVVWQSNEASPEEDLDSLRQVPWIRHEVVWSTYRVLLGRVWFVEEMGHKLESGEGPRIPLVCLPL